jgi:hypothetical protein
MYVQQLFCVLELVGVSRASQNSDESVWIKLDNYRLVVRIIAERVQPPETPHVIPRGLSSIPLGTTSKIHFPPSPLRKNNKNCVVLSIHLSSCTAYIFVSRPWPLAWFQASVTVWMRSSLFWDVMHHGLVVCYQHFWTICWWSRFASVSQSKTACPLEDGIGMLYNITK